MIKNIYTCDKCKKETPADNIHGTFQFVTDAKNKQGRREDYCDKCLVKILKAINKIK